LDLLRVLRLLGQQGLPRLDPQHLLHLGQLAVLLLRVA
jgi:hypothetical protein